MVGNNIQGKFHVTTSDDRKEVINDNNTSGKQINENTEENKKNEQNTLTTKTYLKRNELDTRVKGVFLIISMVTQFFNTALELQEEYYYKIAQTLGYETIEKTKCTTTDDIIEKLQIYNAKRDVCFALALIVHEKDTRFTETRGMKQILDVLLTVSLPKTVPKIVFIEAFRGGNYEIEQGSINDYILSYEMKNTLVAYSTITSESLNQNEVFCSTFTKCLLDEVQNNAINTEIHKACTLK